MKITDLLSSKTINLNAKASNKTNVLNQAIALMCKSGVISDKKTYTKGVFAREKISTTGVGEGIAIPHCKSNVVVKPQLAAMVIKDGVDFASLDGEKVQLLFLIAAPDNKDNVHLDVLARLSTLLMHEEFKASLLAAKNTKEFLDAIDKAEEQALKEEAAKAEPKEEVKKEDEKKWPEIVCVTACATGVAHTYMAQEALDKAAKQMGKFIKVETRGANPKNFLSQEEIDHAKAVIISADVAVPMERFNGKPLLSVGTSKAIKDAKGLINLALSGNLNTYKALGTSKSSVPLGTDSKSFGGPKESLGSRLYKQLLNGLSHMVPFVVAGGILLAISYIIDAACGVDKTAATGFGTTTLVALIFNMLGNNLVLGLMVPILAGFISYSIAGKQGAVSGFAAGFCCVTVITVWSAVKGNAFGTKVAFNIMWFIDFGINGQIGKALPKFAQLAVDSTPGFLGGVFGGFAAGYITIGLQRAMSKFPRPLAGVRDMLLVPLLSTFLMGTTMILLNCPFSFATYGISLGLNAIGNSGLIYLLGFLLGALTSIDMGGPINKAAHLCVLGIMAKATEVGIMSEYGLFAQHCLAANIAGSLCPPIGIALSCWLFPQKFEEEDRKPAAANLVTGICGITEGAIPYVAKQPRTWIATISGAGIAGLIAVGLNAVAIAPEGGTIAYFVMGQDCWRGLLAALIGSLWVCFVLGLIRKDAAKTKAKLGRWKGIPTKHVQWFFVTCGHGIAHGTKYVFSPKYRESLHKKKKHKKNK